MHSQGRPPLLPHPSPPPLPPLYCDRMMARFFEEDLCDNFSHFERIAHKQNENLILYKIFCLKAQCTVDTTDRFKSSDYLPEVNAHSKECKRFAVDLNIIINLCKSNSFCCTCSSFTAKWIRTSESIYMNISNSTKTCKSASFDRNALKCYTLNDEIKIFIKIFNELFFSCNGERKTTEMKLQINYFSFIWDHVR